MSITYRCQCGKCEVMPTGLECVCCCEVDEITRKMQENSTSIQCITEHEGFPAVCLNVWVLQAAYFNYRQRYGHAEEKDQHE